MFARSRHHPCVPPRGLALALFSLALASLACDNSTGPKGDGPEPAPEIVSAADVANFGDARDIEVTFSETGGRSAVSEYRIFVSTGDVAGTSPLPTSGTFHSVAPADGDISTRLSQFVTDESGAALEEGIPYVAYVQAWTGSDSTSVFSAPSDTFTLTLQHEVESLAQLAGGTGGVAVDAEGNIFVADFGDQLSSPDGTEVYRVTPEGDVTTFATGFLGASGNAFDSNGTLLQSSIAGNTIHKVASDGTPTLFASGPAIVGPVGIAVAPGDTLYVANCNNNTVAKVDPDGNATTFASSPLFSCPNGIALASDGNLYVANFFNGNLLQVRPDGSTSIFLTFSTGNLGHVTFGNDVLYLVDRGRHLLWEVGLNQEARLLAGTGARGRADGVISRATLSFPNDLMLSPDGSILYFNDVDPGTPGSNQLSPSWLRMVRLARD